MSWKEICLVVLLVCCSMFTSTKANESEGRKLFGGYKITPRFCKATRRIEIHNPGPNICMFNHECATRQGIVVGACMDGFLFGACCQLPGSTAGELVESDQHHPQVPNNVLDLQTKTTYGPTVDVISNGVSHITESFLDNQAITTAQDNEIVQINGRPEDFGYSPGIIHSSTPETLVLHSDNDIDPLDFKIPEFTQTTDRSSTSRIEDATAAYSGGTVNPGLIQIAVSHAPYLTSSQSFQRPMFRPRPTTSNRPQIEDKYVLVPTITHPIRPNKTQEFDTIVNIVQLLNDTSTPIPFLSSSRPSTIYLQYTDQRKPTTLPYNSATTRYPTKTTSKRPFSTPLTVSSTVTKRPSTSNSSKLKASSKKPPSTSYVYSTTIPPRRTTQPVRKPPTSTTTKKPTTKKQTYIYPPSTLRPGAAYASTSRPITTPTKYGSYTTARPTTTKYGSYTTARPTTTKYTATSRPGTVTPTSKPPSTSYVTGPTPPRRPSTVSSHVAGPSYSVVSPTKNGYTSTYGSPPPPVIVFAPITAEDPPSYQQEVTTTARPKPVTQLTINNIVTANNNYHFSTSERPPPTVLITPKPPSSIITAGSYRPIFVTTDYTTNAEIEIETSANDINNFPPVRNPNLNTSAQVASTEEDFEFTTPIFIEDKVLDKKVESFVNKIVQSLQEPFNELKDVVYKTNVTSFTSTKRPTTVKKSSTTKRPLRVSLASSTRPTTSLKPTSQRLTTRKPTTRRTTTARTTTTTVVTTTTRRTKPTRRITTTPAPVEEEYDDENATDEELDYRRHCGVRPLIKTGRIVGGKGSTFGEWPWQVLVRESTWLGLFTKNKCGGVLISKNFVVTAAHCQPGFLASLVAVFGEYDISGDLESKRPMSKNVKRVIVHRQYDAATFENDLALLELESPVEFDQHIVPICLPRGDEDFTGRYATVTGWGRLKYGGGVPSVLQEVKVPIMENHVCQEMFRTAGHNKIILDSFLCAGYANGQKDSCEGDSGGPLVLQRPDGRWQLAGTVSHGIKCAAPYLPGVYMRTTYYKPWLESITGVH